VGIVCRGGVCWCFMGNVCAGSGSMCGGMRGSVRFCG